MQPCSSHQDLTSDQPGSVQITVVCFSLNIQASNIYHDLFCQQLTVTVNDTWKDQLSLLWIILIGVWKVIRASSQLHWRNLTWRRVDIGSNCWDLFFPVIQWLLTPSSITSWSRELVAFGLLLVTGSHWWLRDIVHEQKKNWSWKQFSIGKKICSSLILMKRSY